MPLPKCAVAEFQSEGFQCNLFFSNLNVQRCTYCGSLATHRTPIHMIIDHHSNGTRGIGDRVASLQMLPQPWRAPVETVEHLATVLHQTLGERLRGLAQEVVPHAVLVGTRSPHQEAVVLLPRPRPCRCAARVLGPFPRRFVWTNGDALWTILLDG